MSKKIIRGGTIVTAVDTVLADVLIDGETIAGVGSFDGVDAEVIDATGCFVLPGAIDNHTHISMPFGGTTTADDYDTGTQAAAAGGTTCLVDFALQMEPNGLRSSLDQWMGRAEGCAHVDYGFHMAITKADAGTFADMGAMVDAGVTTFKVFMAYPNVLMVTDDLFLAVLEQTQADRRPRDGARRERVRDRPPRQERAGGRQHRPDLPRADAAGGVRGRGHGARDPARRVRGHADLHRPRLVQARRRRGHRRPCARRPRLRRDLHPVPLRVDRRPPPARTSRARATSARRRCATPPTSRTCGTRLNFDHLQSISTDHCPFTDEQKRLGFGDFSKIPNGLAAIQHRLPLLWEHGVKTGRMTPNRFVEVTSTAIAKIFGLYPRKGTIAPGADADIVIFDPRAEHVFSTATSLMNVDYDLWEGQKVSGSPRQTLCRGTVVFDDGKILTRPGARPLHETQRVCRAIGATAHRCRPGDERLGLGAGRRADCAGLCPRPAPGRRARAADRPARAASRLARHRFGCGPGAFAEALTARGAKVTAIRLGPRDAGRRRGPRSRLRAVQADALRSRSSGSHDAACLVQVLEYLADPVAAIREAARVVHPGGAVLVADTDWDTQGFNVADRELGRRVVQAWADGKPDGGRADGCAAG